jgi:hypothetical protein
VSFRSYEGVIPAVGADGQVEWRNLYVPGSGEDFLFQESNENFQQYPDGNWEQLAGVDAYGNLQFLFELMVGGLDHLHCGHDLQNEADGNTDHLSGGVGWDGDIQIVTPA